MHYRYLIITSPNIRKSNLKTISMLALETIKPDSKPSLSDEDLFLFAKDIISQMQHQEIFPKIQKIEPLNAFYIDGFLTESECSEFIKNVDDCNQLSFWSGQGRGNPKVRLFRDADTIEMKHKILEREMWNRLKTQFPFDEINVFHNEDEMENNEMWERDLVGKWIACGLNEDLLFARYPCGGHFAPHTDGRAIHHFNRRSFFSVIIFLNSIPIQSGGGTRFYKEEAVQRLTQNSIDSPWSADPSLVTAVVEAVAGRILIFDQSLVHEGMPTTPPYQKYIIRSDIMFRRSPAICDGPVDREAYRVYCEAQRLAESGDVDQSIVLFRRAFKLSPALAVLLGQG